MLAGGQEFLFSEKQNFKQNKTLNQKSNKYFVINLSIIEPSKTSVC